MKRNPIACSPENCGDLFPKCGTNSTYSYKGCRCDACCEAGREYARKQRAKKPKNTAPIGDRCECTPENCGELFPICGKQTTYSQKKCRCDACRAAKAEQARRYRDGNKPRIAASKREYREKNSGKVRAKKRRYYEENREALLAKTYAWTEANPERARANRRRGFRKWRALKLDAVTVPYTLEQLAQRMAYYGNACYLKLEGCTVVGTDIEHVKPLSKGGSEMLCNLRPACKSCNSRKNAKWPFAA